MPSARFPTESDLRSAVRSELVSRHAGEQRTRIIEELGLRHGAARVDLAVVNGEIHGYELKSACDSLRRLPRQVRLFDSALDRVTIVVAECHYPAVISQVPGWWGIVLGRPGCGDEVILERDRQADVNPSVDLNAIVKFLWRSEGVEILHLLGAATGFRSKRRREIYSRLVEIADKQWLMGEIRNRLITRHAP
jgi:hypothetical protein